jgi:hypothetical protein
MQPDRGTLCAYWLAVLISTLVDEYDEICIEFRLYALRALEATLFVYTGAAIPRPLRAPLVAAMRKVLLGVLHKRKDELSGMACTAMRGVLRLVKDDDAFAEHVRCCQLLCVHRNTGCAAAGEGRRCVCRARALLPWASGTPVVSDCLRRCGS